MEIKIYNALETIKKTARAHGNGAMVLVPKSWAGKEVQIVLLDDDEL